MQTPGAPEADGIVVLPKAGGYSAAEMIQQQDLVNRKQSVFFDAAQVQNLSFPSAVHRVSDTLQGMSDDWLRGNRSFGELFGKDNRLQGLGLLMVTAAMGGLIIDVVLTY